MEIGKTANVGLMIGLVVSLMLVAYIMVPFISDTSNSIGTEMDNDGYGAYFSDENASVVCASKVWSIDGTAMTGTSAALVSDKAVMTFTIGSTNYGSMYFYDGTTANVKAFTVTDSGFTYVNAGTNESTDVACEYVYYSAPSGEYAYYTGTGFNINDGDRVVSFVIDTAIFVVDLADTSVEFCTVSTVETDASVVLNGTVTDNDAYETWSDGSYTVTYGDNDTTVTYNKVIAPIHYTDRTSEQNSMVSILGIIPVIVIIALLMIVVYRVIRND